MTKLTRDDIIGCKIDKILEYWNEGWEGGDFGDIINELNDLHLGQKRLCDLDDDEIDGEYENALKYFKELDGGQE